MCAYDFRTLLDLLTHNHAHDNINNHNDDKTVDVENKVESDNAPENNVGEVKVKDEPEDVFEKIIGTGACDDCE